MSKPEYKSTEAWVVKTCPCVRWSPTFSEKYVKVDCPDCGGTGSLRVGT